MVFSCFGPLWQSALAWFRLAAGLPCMLTGFSTALLAYADRACTWVCKGGAGLESSFCPQSCLSASGNLAGALAYLPRGRARMRTGLESCTVSTLAACLCRMGMHKGAADPGRPAGPLPLARLVECLQKLGGVGEAQLTFKRHMPTQVCPPARRLEAILESAPTAAHYDYLAGCAEAIHELPKSSQYGATQVSLGADQSGAHVVQVRNVILRALQQSQIDKTAAAAKTHEAAAKAAQAAVERVFEHCLQVRTLRCLSPCLRKSLYKGQIGLTSLLTLTEGLCTDAVQPCEGAVQQECLLATAKPRQSGADLQLEMQLLAACGACAQDKDSLLAVLVVGMTSVTPSCSLSWLLA